MTVFREGEFDPLGGIEPGGEGSGSASQVESTSSVKEPKPEKKTRLIELYSPAQLRAYEPPPNQNMLGDYQIQRGAISVLAGPPGCGKSLATLQLALAGARGSGDWFGMPIHTRFRTLILQNENGMTRLHRDFTQLPAEYGIDDYIRISSPPPYGLALQNPMFRNELAAMIRDHEPHLLIIDPWNACLRDAMEKDFQEALARVREIAAASPNQPATLILHHLRKPKSDDRHRGRNLAHLLSGSYVLVSVARCVMVMQPASDDVEDNRVVMTVTKNNDGQLGPRTAWERRDRIFEPIHDFDWDAYDNGSQKTREPKVQLFHLQQIFQNGSRLLSVKQAAEELQSLAAVGRSAAYFALKLEGGRFSAFLSKDKETSLLKLGNLTE